ncbi:3840_t:CDS:2, partial [Gigaspora rosea]
MEDITNTQSNVLNSIVDLFNQPTLTSAISKKKVPSLLKENLVQKIRICANICKKGLKILSGSSSLKGYKWQILLPLHENTLIIVGQYYDTKKEILDAAQENAKNLGFGVAIKNTRQRKRMSKRCECPYLLKAVLDNSKWRVSEIKDEHNHSKAKDFQVFHEHHQLTRDVRQIAVKMLKADAKPSMVYEAVRNDDETPTATRKDISNLSARIHSVEERILMEALITGMEERVIKIIEKFIHSRYCEALDTAMAAYNRLALSSLYKTEVLKYLESSLDRWLRLHHEENSLQNKSESIGIDPLLNELLKATTYEACLCELCVNYNIPCRHMLPKEGTVMLSIIPTRWLLFSDRDWPDPNSQEPDLANLKSSDTFFSLKFQLYKIERRYMGFPDEQQKFTLLEKLDEILAVPAIDLSEVKMPEKIKVKPIEKKHNGSTNDLQDISSK